MRKILAAGAVVAAAATALITGTAQAESNPACGSVTQIGATAYVKNLDTTVASVKQFKGCGKNWSYVYVWDQWIASHGRDFILRTQQEDGTWHVVSRSFGFQPYFQSGFPYEHDQWISQAGTAMAVIGLSFAAK